jgi:5,10-methylenetetrahydromethanopterin reductase
VTVQLWSSVPPMSTTSGRTARRLEEAGWDGVVFPDSQNVAADVVVAMTLAATATTTLQIATGVTNPVTRHPVVLASAAVALQELSGGRFTLGIGRGDSALAHLAIAPAPMRVLERAVQIIRALVQGDDVAPADLAAFQIPGLEHVDTVELGHGVDSARLGWRDTGTPPPSVEVSASGPRTIAFGARHSDGVMLAVGAELDRVRWAVDTARANGAARVGVYLNVVAHDDCGIATGLARQLVAPFARFSVMDGVVRAPTDDGSRHELAALHSGYDMRGHGSATAAHAGELSEDFIRSFGVVGPPDECLRRLREIAALDIDRIIVVGPTAAAERRDAVNTSRALFNTEVLPNVKTP